MRVLSQVYQSEEDHVEVRGLDPRVGKSCILESHLWTRIVRERGSLKTHISFLDPMFERVDHVVNCVSLCLFVRFRLSSMSLMISPNTSRVIV